MPYCTNCGKPYKENHKFCQSCGLPIEPLTAVDQPAAPPAARTFESPAPAAPAPALPGNETVMAVIPDLRKNNAFGKRDSYYLMVTDRRSIFAKVTEQVGQKALQLRQQKAQVQNLGFFGRWKAQVAGPDMYTEYFKTLAPDQLLADSRDNFAVDNSQIQMVRFKFNYRDDEPSEWQLEFITAGNSLKFITLNNPEKLLKQVFGARFTK